MAQATEAVGKVKDTDCDAAVDVVRYSAAAWLVVPAELVMLVYPEPTAMLPVSAVPKTAAAPITKSLVPVVENVTVPLLRVVPVLPVGQLARLGSKGAAASSPVTAKATMVAVAAAPPLKLALIEIPALSALESTT